MPGVNDRVLVTGVTGFVGGALTARLVAKGYAVVALVRAENREQATARVARSLSRFLGSREGSVAADSVHVLVGDTPDAFAHQCVRLMTDAALGQRLAAAAWSLFSGVYTTAAVATSGALA